MRKLFLVLLFLGCQEEEEEVPLEGEYTEVDLFHGTYTVDPGSYLWISFTSSEGDTLFFEARAQNGRIDYAFWSDSVNYSAWASGGNAELFDYSEDVPSVSFRSALEPNTYYVVVGNSSSSPKTYWVRSYLKGVR